MRKQLQNIRFRNKLAIYYILVALIPFIVFAMISSSVFLTSAQNTAMQHTSQITTQVSNSIDIYISSIDKLAQNWVVNIQRNGVLDLSSQDPSWTSFESISRRNMEDNATSYREVAGMLIAFSDNRYISTGMTRISSDPFTDEIWYHMAEDNLGSFVLVSSATGRNIVTNEAYSVDDVFSLVRAIPDPKTGEVRGVVLIDVRHDIIKDSINRATIGNQGFAFVFDTDKEIVYTPMNSVVYRVNLSYLQEEVPMTMTVGAFDYHIRAHKSEYTGWNTVGVFSMNEVLAGINAVYPVLIFCIIIVLILIIAVSFGVANSVTKPISKLQKLMRTAESGNLSIRFNSLYEDEIGDLGRSFNHMLERIDSLINQVYQEQRRKRDAELKILQEQIKPHFLYNTLDTIGWMARDHGAFDIVKLIDALTIMFRIGLSRGKDFVTVDDEITHLSNYLYIQKIRYRDKLNYDVQIDDSINKIEIPKLILQPLIENAIYHGIKQKRGGGNITIKGGLIDEEFIRFTVEDDGAGLPYDRLNELRAQLTNTSEIEKRQTFGLFYVDERIKLCYGNEFGIDIDSVLGEGTLISITIPTRRSDGRG